MLQYLAFPLTQGGKKHLKDNWKTLPICLSLNVKYTMHTLRETQWPGWGLQVINRSCLQCRRGAYYTYYIKGN